MVISMRKIVDSDMTEELIDTPEVSLTSFFRSGQTSVPNLTP